MSWQSLITQIWHTARWDWVKYADNKYKNVGTESHNCFLFYGGGGEWKQTIQKLGWRENHFFPGHLRGWVAAQPILIIPTIRFPHSDALGFLIQQYSCLKAQKLIIVFMLLPIAFSACQSASFFQQKPANKHTDNPRWLKSFISSLFRYHGKRSLPFLKYSYRKLIYLMREINFLPLKVLVES